MWGSNLNKEQKTWDDATKRAWARYPYAALATLVGSAIIWATVYALSHYYLSEDQLAKYKSVLTVAEVLLMVAFWFTAKAATDYLRRRKDANRT